MIAGLDVTPHRHRRGRSGAATGLVDDMTETPADYADMLAAMKARGLTMLCANPDLVVHRGTAAVYCAGALAQDYEEMGGAVIYYGKPHLPVYDTPAPGAPLAAPKRPLAVGDGLVTDIRGANAAGLDGAVHRRWRSWRRDRALYCRPSGRPVRRFGAHGWQRHPHTEMVRR